MMTMSTIGYGDISPVTSAERIVACVMMLVGAGIYAYVVGSITSTVQVPTHLHMPWMWVWYPTLYYHCCYYGTCTAAAVLSP